MTERKPAVEAIIVETEQPAPRNAWERLEVRLARLEDWANPILVKEARQAIKSKQFLIAFCLLLICAVGWSFLGVAAEGLTAVMYGAYGPQMFMGYYVILAVPLIVIVPYGAFRSLAAEREDRTYELLSITTLSPRRIVAGKLAGALLQMIVYFSAMSPCLAFTYMLRGIDMPTILFLLAVTFLASLGLSLVALLASTIINEKYWQVILSVVVVGGLGLSCWGMWTLAYILLFAAPIPFEEPGFWVAMAAMFTAYVSYFVLLFLAAAAQLTFEGANRSTALRGIMLAQQVLLAGWVIYIWRGPAQAREAVEFTAVFALLLIMHWWVMGVLMTGENPHLSPRVRRQLPQTTLGRVLLSWLQPGPGRGYVFALTNLAAGMLVAYTALEWALDHFPGSLSSYSRSLHDPVVNFMWLGFCYAAVYVGLGKLLFDALRKFAKVTMFLVVAVQIALLAAGVAVPMVIVSLTTGYYGGYSSLQVTDPFTTLAEVVERNSRVPEAVYFIVPAVAVIVIAVNLPAVFRELRQGRVETPRRVARDDAQQAPPLPVPAPTPRNPWE